MTDEDLLKEIISDIESYDSDKYHSEMLRIKKKNKESQPAKPTKPTHDYQCKKRLATMTLLKNKVPQVKIEEDYMSHEQIYKTAATLYKQRLLTQI